jgi:hypothetical protein
VSEFEEAAEGIYAEVREALDAAWGPILEVGACMVAVGRVLVEFARAAWRHRP